MSATVNNVIAVWLMVLPAVVVGQPAGGIAAVLRSPEDNNHDRSYQGLYGNVRSVTTERKQIETVFGKPKWGKLEPSVASTFDAQGRELERLIYAVKGFPTKTVNRYDANGRLAVSESWGSNSQLIGAQTYEYGSDGRLREIDVSNGIHFRLEYDSDGRLWRKYGSDNAAGEGPRFAPIPAVTEFRYDAKGRLIEQANFNADGSKGVGLADVHRIVTSYDNPAGCIAVSWQKTDGTITLINRIECYDPLKPRNAVEQFLYEPDGKVKSRLCIEYTFDAVGNWTKSVTKRWDGTSWLPVAYEYRRIEYLSAADPSVTVLSEECRSLEYENQNQIDYGPFKVRRIEGVARDLQSNGVPQTCIGIFSEPGHTLLSSVETSENGSFGFGSIRPGKYRLVAKQPGFGVANVVLAIVGWPSGGILKNRELVIHLRPKGLDTTSFVRFQR